MKTAEDFFAFLDEGCSCDSINAMDFCKYCDGATKSREKIQKLFDLCEVVVKHRGSDDVQDLDKWLIENLEIGNRNG